jgi:hypothetical protein
MSACYIWISNQNSIHWRMQHLDQLPCYCIETNEGRFVHEASNCVWNFSHYDYRQYKKFPVKEVTRTVYKAKQERPNFFRDGTVQVRFRFKMTKPKRRWQGDAPLFRLNLLMLGLNTACRHTHTRRA